MASRVFIPYVVSKIVSSDLQPVVGATVTITSRPTGGAVNVYAAETGGSPLGSITTNSQGEVGGWIAEGSYNMAVSGGSPSISAYTQAFEAVYGAGVENVAAGAIGTTQIQNAAVGVAQTSFVLEGTYSAIPAAGSPPRWYWATDQEKMYYDNGTIWELVPIPGQIPGQLLATHNYTGVSSYGFSTLLVPLDSTNATLAFTVPTSGHVYIDVSGYWYSSLPADEYIQAVLGILNHSGGAQLGSTQLLALFTNEVGGGGAGLGNVVGTFFNRFYLTGLTPGALQIDIAGAASSSPSGGNGFWIYTGSATGNEQLTYWQFEQPLLIQAFAA
jgi:hypothetical protein